jgi:hypothetical protein
MIGVEVSADATKSAYLAAEPTAADFSVVAADGQTTIGCVGLSPSSVDARNTAAILAAVGGDVAYEPTDASGNENETPSGWIVCQTTTSTDSAFDKPGYTIEYDRATAKTTDGVVLPEFSGSVPVKP